MDHGAVDRAEADALDHRHLGTELRRRENLDVELAAALLCGQALQGLMTLVIHAADRLIVAKPKLRLGGGMLYAGERAKNEESSDPRCS